MDSSSESSDIYQPLKRLFDKYDLDDSGSIDSKVELRQLATNTAFLAADNYGIDVSLAEIDVFVSMHEDRMTKGAGLSFDEYAALVIPAFRLGGNSASLEFSDTTRRILETSAIASDPGLVGQTVKGSSLHSRLFNFFSKYDLDASGLIDDSEELRLLAVNAAFLASEFNVFVKQDTIDTFIDDLLPRVQNGGVGFEEFASKIVPAYKFPVSKVPRFAQILQQVEQTMPEDEDEDEDEDVGKRVEDQVPDEGSYAYSAFTSGTSCYMFGPDNAVRNCCVAIDVSPAFNLFVGCCIFVVTIVMALDSPIWFPHGSSGHLVLISIDLAAMGVFTVEMLVRIIARTFRGYYANPWCCLDLVVVVTGWMALLVAVPSIAVGPALRSLRLLRTLRTVRTLTVLRWSVAIIQALLDALPQVVNVCYLMAFMVLCYAIVGLQWLKGAFHQQCFLVEDHVNVTSSLPMFPNPVYCSKDHFGTDFGPGYICPHGFRCLDIGKNPFQGRASYDNIGLSLLTIFQVTTLEGWVVLMYATQRAAGPLAVVYYLTMVIFLIFMVNNVFVAVICFSFRRTRRRQKAKDDQEMHAAIDQSQSPESELVDVAAQGAVSALPLALQKQDLSPGVDVSTRHGIVAADSPNQSPIDHTMLQETGDEPRLVLEELAEPARYHWQCAKVCACCFTSCQQICCENIVTDLLEWIWDWGGPAVAETTHPGQIVQSKSFKRVIIVAIMLNILIMAMQYHGMSQTYEDVLDAINTTLGVAFTVEMLLKWCGLGGLRYYFKDMWHCLDFLLVMLFLVSAGSASGFSALRGLRSLRIIRALKSLKILRSLTLFRTLERLYLSFASCAPAIAAQLTFVLVTMCIFSIFGMQLFAGDEFKDENGDTPRMTFNTFPNSMFTCFLILTAEGWNEIMYNAMRVEPFMAVLFCTTFFVLVNYALMEMLIAVMMENFEISDEQKLILQRLKVTGIVPNNGVSTSNETLDRNKELDEYVMHQMTESRRRGDTIVVHCLLCIAVSSVALNEGRNSKAWVLMLYLYEWKLNHVRDLKMGRKKGIRKNSMYFFDENHPLRLYAKAVVRHHNFEWCILVVIVLSSLLLAIDTPNPEYRPSWLDTASDVLGPVFVTIFFLEFLLKWLALGFWGHYGSYCSDALNVFDLFVLVLSVVSMVASSLTDSAPVAHAFRAVRAVRPLRMVNKSKALRLMLEAIGTLMPQLLNVLVLLFLCTFLFALAAVVQFMGALYHCNNNRASGKEDCVGNFEHLVTSGANTENGVSIVVPAVWANPPCNFDNIGSAIQVMIEVSSLEGWNEIMFSAMDITDEDKQPSPNASWWNAFMFLTFVVLTSFVFVSLMVTIIIDQFNRTVGRGMLTENQNRFRAILHHATVHPRLSVNLPPLQGNDIGLKCRRFIYGIVNQQVVKVFMMLCLVGNVIVLMCSYAGASEAYEHRLDVASYVFSYVFLLELILRCIAFDLVVVFSSTYEIVDACIVIALASASTMSILLFDPLQWSFTSALRSLRLLTTIRMLKHLRELRVILQTLMLSFPAISNVLALMVITFFVYSVFGMQIFGNVRYGKFINSDANFEYFVPAFILLARAVTGEDWPRLMHDCSIESPRCTPEDVMLPDGTLRPGDCGNKVIAILFFNSFYLFGAYLVMNLFVAVIVESFSDCMKIERAGISQESIQQYGCVWNQYTQDSEPALKYLLLHKLPEFLLCLGEPLGVSKPYRRLLGAQDPRDHQMTRRLRLIQAECRQDGTHMPNGGRMLPAITYRKLLIILCMHSADADFMPYAEKVSRQDFLTRLTISMSASRMAASWRGFVLRKKLRAMAESNDRSSAQAKLDSIACAIASNNLDLDAVKYLQERIEHFQSSGVLRQTQLLRDIAAAMGKGDPQGPASLLA